MPLTYQLQMHILIGRLVHKSQEKGFHCTAFYFSEAKLVSAKQLKAQCQQARHKMDVHYDTQKSFQWKTKEQKSTVYKSTAARSMHQMILISIEAKSLCDDM